MSIEHKNHIVPSCAQDLLASATNAAAKGLAQYNTSPQIARALALPLPAHRPVICDLTAGRGALLRAARNPSTRRVLACEMDPGAAPPGAVVGDVNQFAGLLCAAAFECDLFTLNPPFGLHWPRALLAPLAGSGLPAVRAAFAAADGHTGHDTIDSTPAMLCLALDRCSHYGEGYLITYAPTAERLILNDGAPHGALRDHVWAAVNFPFPASREEREAGEVAASSLSPLGGERWGEGASAEAQLRDLWDKAGVPKERQEEILRDATAKTQPGAMVDPFQIPLPSRPSRDIPCMVLYFAAAHTSGPRASALLEASDPESLESVCRQLSARRLELRDGAEVRPYCCTKNTARVWEACAQEWRERQKPQRTDINIFLDRAGCVQTQLNVFEERLSGLAPLTSHLEPAHVKALFQLNGKTPMQLVLQRAQRAALEKATAPDSPWRVQPDLHEAVRVAVALYHADRAPLYPLNDVQRLGYLDEAESIVCKKPLGQMEDRGLPMPVFRPGASYQVETATLTVTRPGTKRNLQGETEDVEYTGSELALWLTGADGERYLFMDKRCAAPGVKITGLDGKPMDTSNPQSAIRNPQSLHPFNDLTVLIDHFIIPAVPDVSQVRPAEFGRAMSDIARLEQLCAITYRDFQKEDLARLTIRQGGVLGWDTGLGKTWAMFTFPLLMMGQASSPAGAAGVSPASPDTDARVLLIAPGDLHEQIMDSGRKFFGLDVTRLDSQKTFFKLLSASPCPRVSASSLPPGFYLSSYTELTQNGVDDFPALNDPEFRIPDSALDAEAFFRDRYNLYKNAYDLLAVDPGCTLAHLEKEARQGMNQYSNSGTKGQIKAAFDSIRIFHTNITDPSFDQLPNAQRTAILDEVRRREYHATRKSVGQVRQMHASTLQPFNASTQIKCLSSPTLVDLCGHLFQTVVLDEGTRIQNEDTLTYRGIEQLEAPCRLVMSATPVKNRLPSIFTLICWALNIKDTATPRFPYKLADKEAFAREFLISEANLTKMDRDKARRTKDGTVPKRYQKLTPQVCNVHRLWKLLGPIIARRSKQALARGGMQLVGRTKNLIRVPMGTAQKEVYEYHLCAPYTYTDKQGRVKPNIGAKVQALRVAAADPSSPLLHSVPK